MSDQERFAINTEQITWLQNEIRDANIEIKKGRVDQATLNAELKSEVDARKRADSDLQAQIDAIDVGDPFDPTQLQEEIEAEKSFRIQGDLEQATNLQQEVLARQRGDSDLQAQIDALEPAEGGVDLKRLQQTRSDRTML